MIAICYRDCAFWREIFVLFPNPFVKRTFKALQNWNFIWSRVWRFKLITCKHKFWFFSSVDIKFWSYVIWNFGEYFSSIHCLLTSFFCFFVKLALENHGRTLCKLYQYLVCHLAKVHQKNTNCDANLVLRNPKASPLPLSNRYFLFHFFKTTVHYASTGILLQDKDKEEFFNY